MIKDNRFTARNAVKESNSFEAETQRTRGTRAGKRARIQSESYRCAAVCRLASFTSLHLSFHLDGDTFTTADRMVQCSGQATADSALHS